MKSKGEGKVAVKKFIWDGDRGLCGVAEWSKGSAREKKDGDSRRSVGLMGGGGGGQINVIK